MSASDSASGSTHAPLTLVGVEALVFRVPLATPVQTSFGLMHDRPACFVRVVDETGTTGWGEIWCNFPQVGAEHRARLLIDSIAPAALGKAWPDPAAAHEELTRQFHVLSIQTGEPGPIAQVLAGLDIALWDLVGRRLAQPLWRLLGGRSSEVAVYASGLNPTEPQRMALRAAEAGHVAFKLKVGFGEQRDLANLRALRQELGEAARLMVDANQAWTPGEARRMAAVLAPCRIDWLEEPITADQPLAVWQALAHATDVPLAAGENLRGEQQFNDFLTSKALGIVQPDIAKWGGFSLCTALGRRIDASGARFCPHWLGGGIGLAASLHLKAAVGGAGRVEIDANPNPLRDLFVHPLATVDQGRTILPDTPGLGVQPDLASARRFLTTRLSAGQIEPLHPS